MCVNRFVSSVIGKRGLYVAEIGNVLPDICENWWHFQCLRPRFDTAGNAEHIHVFAPGIADERSLLVSGIGTIVHRPATSITGVIARSIITFFQ
jgi:hypothetical protein